MKTTDQVAGEAREKLAEALDYFRPHWLTNGPVMLTPEKMREHLAVIEAALRAQPERGAEEMRERCLQAVHSAFVPMSASASDAFTERGIGLAIAAIRALPLHPDKDEGGATDA